MKRNKLKEKLIENGISKEWLDDKMIHISDDANYKKENK
jgi:hypothetical protein